MTHQQSRLESLWTFLALLVVVVAAGLLLWLGIELAYPDLSDRANFGNMFGGINTLFAGLAFAALTYTLFLQERALRLQRGQILDQAQALAEQNTRLSQQAFESMLVQLLGFHHEIVTGTWYRSIRGEFSGRSAMRALADDLRIEVDWAGREGTAQRNPAYQAEEGYRAFHDRVEGVLDHYFRNLYHIIRFIDDSQMPDRRRYTSLVRAQLSPSELQLLFYDGLSPLGEKFKPLIEKYALLEHAPIDELPNPAHQSLYGPGAYGST